MLYKNNNFNFAKLIGHPEKYTFINIGHISKDAVVSSIKSFHLRITTSIPSGYAIRTFSAGQPVVTWLNFQQLHRNYIFIICYFMSRLLLIMCLA